MKFSLDSFNKIKKDAEEFYNSIGKVHCPYFKENVSFNSGGFEHLIFKRWNKTRIISDQLSRLRHIKLAPQVISQSRTLQGYWATNKIERVKRKNGWEKIMKLVSYYEFIAVMESHGSKVRVKIIVKQVEGGEKFFLSLIPFWGTDKLTGERVLHSGNPEND